MWLGQSLYFDPVSVRDIIVYHFTPNNASGGHHTSILITWTSPVDGLLLLISKSGMRYGNPLYPSPYITMKESCQRTEEI
jgi:hypothetical protein